MSIAAKSRLWAALQQKIYKINKIEKMRYVFSVDIRYSIKLVQCCRCSSRPLLFGEVKHLPFFRASKITFCCIGNPSNNLAEDLISRTLASFFLFSVKGGGFGFLLQRVIFTVARNTEGRKIFMEPKLFCFHPLESNQKP